MEGQHCLADEAAHDEVVRNLNDFRRGGSPSDHDLKFARLQQRQEVGESGCVKSTLLQLIGGLLPQQRGRITVSGEVNHPGVFNADQEAFRFPAWRPSIKYAGFYLIYSDLGYA